jgi:hypothetical protein
MKNSFFITLFLLLCICTKPSQSQDLTINFGYIPETEYGSLGFAGSGFELDVMMSTNEDVYGFGGRAGYMFIILGNYVNNLYIGPRVGYKSETYADNSDKAEGLLYEGAAGFHLGMFNVSVGNGYDNLDDTEYISAKAGFYFGF